MTAQRMVYAWASSTRLPKGIDPQALGEQLAQLRESLGQGFSPASVVADARAHPDGPLHAAFGDLWDLTAVEALERALVNHAGYIVRHVRVVTVRVERGEEVRAQRPAFVSIVERTSEERRYLPVARAMTDAEYREQTLEDAYRYFWAGRERFKDLTELASIFRAIEATVAGRRTTKEAPDPAQAVA